MIRTRGCSGVLALLAALILAGSARAFSPENTTFKGDLRLRYQYEQTEKTDGLLQRHRGRFRFRVGFATMMSENIEIGARLATGDTDPRSTNQTATSFFSTKDIRLDRAYVYWDASRQLTVKFGKYSESFLVTDDLLWDSDITFEGGTLDWRKQMAGGAAPFVYGAMSVLEENKTTSKDIQMYVVQPGIVYDSDRLGLKTGLTLYVFEHLKGSMPDDDISSGTNTRVDGNLKYDYDSINPVLFLVYRPAGSGASAPVLKVIGNY
ncbi:MAG: putative porin, partial [bacterium]